MHRASNVEASRLVPSRGVDPGVPNGSCAACGQDAGLSDAGSAEPDTGPARLQCMAAGPEGFAVGATDEVGADRGDRYSALYAEHAPRALRFAYLLTGEHELAEDLVQDAFIKVMGRFGDLRREEAFATYLRKTIVNLSYSTFRRRRVERQYLSREHRYGAAAASTSGPDHGHDDELWSRLEQLPTRQRVALVLRYYEDLSEKQTAATMSCSLRTVKSLVNRGLVALRAQEAFHE